jgi:hypothetical protein
VLIPEQSFSSFGIEMVDLHSPTAPTIARKEAARAAREAYEKRKTRQVTATRVVRAASAARAAPALSSSHLFGDQVPNQKFSLKTSSFLSLANQHRFQPLIYRIDRLKEHITWQQFMHRPVVMARSYAS